MLTTLLSLIAVFDSLADKENAKLIRMLLTTWLHHKAQNPVRGSVKIQYIRAKVVFSLASIPPY